MPALLVLVHLSEDLTFVPKDVTAVLQSLLTAEQITAQQAAVRQHLDTPDCVIYLGICSAKADIAGTEGQAQQEQCMAGAG